MAVTPRTFLRNPLLLFLLTALALPAFAVVGALWTCPSQEAPSEVVLERTVVRAEVPSVPVVYEAPVKEGKGWLGVRIQSMNPKLAAMYDAAPNTRGALVVDVQAGMPSERAGFQSGDIITHYNARPVFSACQFSRMVQSTAPATVVRVRVLRDGEPMWLTPKLTKKAENCRCSSNGR